MESRSEKLAIVIVNWNGKDDTLNCIASIEKSLYPVTHVILVDNGSQDDSIASIQTQYPNVNIIELAYNHHFAAGANIGIHHALDQGATMICLLNNDTIIQPDFFTEMVSVLHSHEDVGIVGGRLVHPSGRVVIGAHVNLRTGAIIEPSPSTYPEQASILVDYVWGAAMLIQASLIHDVGVFDETFVAYFEDTDLCLRASAKGWKTMSALKAEVFHVGSASANRHFLQQMFLRGRNWLKCFWRHAPVEDRGVLLFWMIFCRLPHLIWSTLLTILVRSIRPGERSLKLWSSQ